MVKLNLNSQHKNSLLFILAIFSFVVLVFLINFANTAQKSITTKKQELMALRKDVEALDQIIIDRNEYAAKSKVVTDTLPSSYAEFAYFIEETESIATQSANTIKKQIEPASKDEKNGLRSVSITIESRGNYNNCANMLSFIANLPFHTRIDSIKMEGGGSSLTSLTNFRVYITEGFDHAIK